jgi:hypothetical protein
MIGALLAGIAYRVPNFKAEIIDRSTTRWGKTPVYFSDQ